MRIRAVFLGSALMIVLAAVLVAGWPYDRSKARFNTNPGPTNQSKQASPQLIKPSANATHITQSKVVSLPATSTNNSALTQSKEVPPQVIYEAMFRHLAWLNEKAAEVEKQGQDGSVYRNRYKASASLTDQEAQTLNRVASETLNEVKKIDARAKEIVDAMHAKGTKLEAGQPLPELPAELPELQKERDAIVLAGYAKLRAGFGAERFVGFETFVKEQVASGVKPISSLPRPASGRRMPKLFEPAGKGAR